MTESASTCASLTLRLAIERSKNVRVEERETAWARSLHMERGTLCSPSQPILNVCIPHFASTTAFVST